MSKKIRKTEERHREMIALAIASLVAAREYLILAECPQVLKKVRSALKSADGARRHAEGALIRKYLGRLKCTCHADEANRAIGNHFDDCPLRVAP